ncbi:hypothetical protein P3W23_09115 [Luteibacter sp. PPL554]
MSFFTDFKALETCAAALRRPGVLKGRGQRQNGCPEPGQWVGVGPLRAQQEKDPLGQPLGVPQFKLPCAMPKQLGASPCLVVVSDHQAFGLQHAFAREISER